MTQVSLYTCPAILPYIFAAHTWLVVEDTFGESRWEVGWTLHERGQHWGHIYQNDLPSKSGIQIFPLTRRFKWKAKLVGTIAGTEAEQMAQRIRLSTTAYPWKDTYRLLGPNSNTYVKWILAQFPSCGLRTPWNALG